MPKQDMVHLTLRSECDECCSGDTRAPCTQGPPPISCETYPFPFCSHSLVPWSGWLTFPNGTHHACSSWELISAAGDLKQPETNSAESSLPTVAQLPHAPCHANRSSLHVSSARLWV